MMHAASRSFGVSGYRLEEQELQLQGSTQLALQFARYLVLGSVTAAFLLGSGAIYCALAG